MTMKIMAVCGSGLGSSFILEMNIKTVLQELGITGVEVAHTDLGSATSDMADIFIAAKDIAGGMTHLGEVVVLETILDMDSLRSNLTKALEKQGVLS